MGWRETSKATRRQNLREKGPLLVHCCHDLIRVHTDSILSVLPPPVSLCAQNPNSSLGLYAESAGTRGCATVTAGSTWNSQGSQGSGTPALLQAHCTNPPPSPSAPPGPLCTPSALPPRVWTSFPPQYPLSTPNPTREMQVPQEKLDQIKQLASSCLSILTQQPCWPSKCKVTERQFLYIVSKLGACSHNSMNCQMTVPSPTSSYTHLPSIFSTCLPLFLLGSSLFYHIGNTQMHFCREGLKQ